MRPRQTATVALVLALTVAAFFGTRLFGERDSRLNSEYRAEVAAAQIRGRVEQGSFLAQSLAQFMLSVAGSRDAGEEFWTGVALNLLSEIALQTGRADEAADRVDQALALAQAAGDGWNEGYALGTKAAIAARAACMPGMPHTPPPACVAELP